jgi:hypothetical protein
LRTHHVHVVPADGEEWAKYLAFRDLLRRDPEARDAYAAVKKELALRFSRDRRGYLAGKVEIVVIEHHHEPWDLGCLLSLGIDPRTKRYVVLKSRVHYRAGFKPIAKAIVECAGVGVCTSGYGELTFKRVRRPIYPLDLINAP